MPPSMSIHVSFYKPSVVGDMQTVLATCRQFVAFYKLPFDKEDRRTV